MRHLFAESGTRLCSDAVHPRLPLELHLQGDFVTSACPNDRIRVTLSQLMRSPGNALESLNSKYQHIPSNALVLTNNSEIPNSISYHDAERTRKVHRHKVLLYLKNGKRSSSCWKGSSPKALLLSPAPAPSGVSVVADSSLADFITERHPAERPR